jgi:Ca2+-transporting ATPase
MALVTLILFSRYSFNAVDLTKSWTISLTMLTVFEWYNIFIVRSHKDSVFSKNIFSNKYLILALFIAISLQMFAIYNGFMQNILRTTALSLNEWGMLLALGTIVIFAEEFRKLIYRRFFIKQIV